MIPLFSQKRLVMIFALNVMIGGNTVDWCLALPFPAVDRTLSAVVGGGGLVGLGQFNARSREDLFGPFFALRNGI